jgi:fructose-bisphosphate aldolase class I
MDSILVVNAGSSSVKFEVFAVDGSAKLTRKIKGQIDGIGTRPRLRARRGDGTSLVDSLCQEQELVPIVEPEVLMDGPHTIERCEEVTGVVLHAVFHALFEQRVALEGMLLKPNMVIAGKECARQASVEEVATATLRCLRRHVPAAVPGIVFLSGGQNARLATAHLNAINRLPGPKPWKVSFSYGRALQDPALEAWHGRDENLAAGQKALYRRARSNGAASVGKYTDEMEEASPNADDPPHRRDWRDD